MESCERECVSVCEKKEVEERSEVSSSVSFNSFHDEAFEGCSVGDNAAECSLAWLFCFGDIAVGRSDNFDNFVVRELYRESVCCSWSADPDSGAKTIGVGPFAHMG